MSEVGNQAPRAWFPKGRGNGKSYAGRRGPQPSQLEEEEEEENEEEGEGEEEEKEEESGVVAQSQGSSKPCATWNG